MQQTPKLNIQIPADHPKAGRFLELARFFSSRQEYASGIVVEKSSPASKEAVEAEMLDLLREFVPAHVLEEFSAKAAAYNQVAKSSGAVQALNRAVAGTIGTPESMAKTVDIIAATGLLPRPERELLEKVRRVALDQPPTRKS